MAGLGRLVVCTRRQRRFLKGPPLVWALAAIAGFALNWFMPLPFVPAVVLVGWLGGAVFISALALFAWAIITITRAGSNVPINMPTTFIVEKGPYRFTRNPIYLGMMLGLVGLAIAFDSLWLLVTLVPFFLVIRYGGGRPGGSLSRAQVRRGLSPVPRRVRRWL